MNNIDVLKNSGFFILNNSKNPSNAKTIVVLGAARGGTTMVASVLQALGVYMGDNLGSVLENVPLSEAVESRNEQLFNELVSTYNSKYEIWGWKRPASLNFFDFWEGKLRNVHFIAIFRDSFAIANRNRISMLSDIFHSMNNSVDYYKSLISFLSNQDSPILLCSYEKSLLNPKKFIENVDNFLNLNVKNKWKIAIEKIEIDSYNYLETSRITHSIGHLDGINNKICKGWCFYIKKPNIPANVKILYNNEIIETVISNMFRKDLKEKGIHPTGLCGFKYVFPNNINIKKGDIIEAIVEGDIKPLTGSPKIIE